MEVTGCGSGLRDDELQDSDNPKEPALKDSVYSRTILRPSNDSCGTREMLQVREVTSKYQKLPTKIFHLVHITTNYTLF